MTHLDINNTSYDKNKGHKKSGIDPTPMRASGVRHAIEKLLMRATTLLPI
jgi:hypothetical protein